MVAQLAQCLVDALVGLLVGHGEPQRVRGAVVGRPDLVVAGHEVTGGDRVGLEVPQRLAGGLRVGWVAVHHDRGRGVDATIGTRCTGRHVIVGIGRDYADVAVLSGAYQGGGQATLDVRVECETLGGSDAMAQLQRWQRADRAARRDPEPGGDAPVPARQGDDAGDGRPHPDAAARLG